MAKPKAKRTLENVVRKTSASPGPGAASPSAASAASIEINGQPTGTSAARPASSNYKSRTVALLNVPDTVNLARLEIIFEKYGPIVKCTLRPDHGGATAEYVEESSVGKAELGLTGMELDGNVVRTGTWSELMRQKPELKGALNKTKSIATHLVPIPRASSNRPATSRGLGRRGGLGKKSSSTTSGRTTTLTDDNDENVGGKSNDYFKTLMSGGGKKDTNEEKAGNEEMET
jgi:hypothetical protein